MTPFSVVLYRPEIPQNTGNIVRLCANTGAKLCIVGEIGFELNNPKLRRAGLDYHDMVDITHHQTLNQCLKPSAFNTYLLTTSATKNYADTEYKPGDRFVFGNETWGVPKDVLSTTSFTDHLSLPMVQNSRSLNLSNSVAVVLYEAWRQTGFFRHEKN